MFNIIIGNLVLSLLHAIIPNHWLPVLVIGRNDNWSIKEVSRITLLSGFGNAISTMIIGLIMCFLGLELAASIQYFTHFVVPGVLIVLGIFYIYQHHRHRHFHLHSIPEPTLAKNKIVIALVVGMFFSPCMEIEAYFLLAGAKGIWALVIVAILYLAISVSGIVMWVRLAYKGILKFNLHAIKHKAGIITGWTLIFTGIISFLFLKHNLWRKKVLCQI